MKSKQKQIAIGLGTLCFVIGFLWIMKYSLERNALEQKAKELTIRRSTGEALILSSEKSYSLYQQMDIKTTPELLRRALSGYMQKAVPIESIDNLITQYQVELSDKELSLVDYGKAVRLAHIMYEMALLPQARGTLKAVLKTEVSSYGKGLLELRQRLEARANNRFKIDSANLEQTLSIVTLNSILEMKMPTEELVKESLGTIQWDTLKELSPEVGKVYILQIMGLYMGQGYYSSGLQKSLWRHWEAVKDKEEYMSQPRLAEAYEVFKALQGK